MNKTPMASAPIGDRNSLVETFLGTIAEHPQVQNTASSIMCAAPVSTMAVRLQQAKITQIPSETLYKNKVARNHQKNNVKSYTNEKYDA